MKHARYDHGCGSLQVNDTIVTIVVGGHVDTCTLLSSTEYLVGNEWHEGMIF